MFSKSWDKHYKKNKSVLNYPDENLVRLIQKNFRTKSFNSDFNVLDLGCGSGRHLQLLANVGIENIFGFDYSKNAINICNNNFSFPLAQCDNRFLPLKNETMDLIIAWGSMHYNFKADLFIMIDEIHRVLKKSGMFFSTLRSINDTYLKKGKELENNTWQTDLGDLNGSIVSFYSEDELNSYFKIFSDYKFGLIERSIIGDLDKKISHFVISAKK